MGIPVTHSSLLPLANTEPIVTDDECYPEKLEELRSKTIEALDATMSYADYKIIEAVTVIGAAATFTATLAIGPGVITFTVGPNDGFVPGMRVKIAATGYSDQFMVGTVSDYDNGQLTVDVTRSVGAGVYSSWGVSLLAEADLPRPYPDGYVMSNDGDNLVWIDPLVTLGSIDLLITEISLTRESDRLITIKEARQPGGAVRLPDARTLRLGDVFEITLGFGILLVRDGDGVSIGSHIVDSTQGRRAERYKLTDNSARAGRWARLLFTDLNHMGLRYCPYSSSHSYQSVPVGTGYSYLLCAYKLDASRYFLTSYDSSIPNAIVVDVSIDPGRLSVDTGALVGMIPSTGNCSTPFHTALMDAGILCVFRKATTGTPTIYEIAATIATVSGKIITSGAVVSLFQTGAIYVRAVKLLRLSANRALIIYALYNDSRVFGRILTISGPNITSGPENILLTVSSASSLSPYIGAINLTDSRVAVIYVDNNAPAAVVLDIAVNTITARTPLVISTAYPGATPLHAVRIDNSRFVASISGMGNGVKLISVSSLGVLSILDSMPSGGSSIGQLSNDMFYINGCVFSISDNQFAIQQSLIVPEVKQPVDVTDDDAIISINTSTSSFSSPSFQVSIFYPIIR